MYSSGTAAAFTADSFVIDTDDYLFKNIQSASTFSLRNSASTYTVSASSDDSSNSSSSSLFLSDAVLEEYVVATQIDRDPPFGNLPVESQSFTVSYDGSRFFDSSSSATGSFGFPVIPNIHTDADSISFTAQLTVSFDTSGFSAFSVSSDLLIKYLNYVYSDSSHLGTEEALASCSILVNGTKVYDWPLFNGRFSQDYFYSGTAEITNISFVFIEKYDDNWNLSKYPVSRSDIWWYFDGSFRIDLLQDDEVLNGFNDNAQDAMNQQNAIESQWTGSMTENFNQLSLSDFSFPVAAVNGFSLISGIFNDLWNVMGDFRIVYVFPLTLGVVLLLIGRLSRTSVKRSSGWGDDDV